MLLSICLGGKCERWGDCARKLLPLASEPEVEIGPRGSYKSLVKWAIWLGLTVSETCVVMGHGPVKIVHISTPNLFYSQGNLGSYFLWSVCLANYTCERKQ